jgi:putative glutamine amidotransferase
MYAPMSIRKPIVGVVSDRRDINGWSYHLVGDKYLQALAGGAGVYPVMLPSFESGFDITEIFDQIDGLFLTGSPSNILPEHYQGTPSREGTWHDPERDVAAFALIPRVIESGMPLLAACRGLQELNVAMGGTLHQLVHEVPGYRVHKENPDDSMEDMYAPSHPVKFTAGGLLESITGVQDTMVNSLHSQGIDRLGKGLSVEARADDGLIEAFVLEDAAGFNLAVQWHPEWQYQENPVSNAIFTAFGGACRKWQASNSI